MFTWILSSVLPYLSSSDHSFIHSMFLVKHDCTLLRTTMIGRWNLSVMSITISPSHPVSMIDESSCPRILYYEVGYEVTSLLHYYIITYA